MLVEAGKLSYGRQPLCLQSGAVSAGTQEDIHLSWLGHTLVVPPGFTFLTSDFATPFLLQHFIVLFPSPLLLVHMTPLSPTFQSYKPENIDEWVTGKQSRQLEPITWTFSNFPRKTTVDTNQDVIHVLFKWLKTGLNDNHYDDTSTHVCFKVFIILNIKDRSPLGYNRVLYVETLFFYKWKNKYLLE